MVCSIWEEIGLLYSSGELSEEEMASFTEHLGQCEECAGEVKRYQDEKRRFFTEEILGASPSEACNAEILRVCSDARKRVAGGNMFSLFIRKSAVSLALFLLGFTVVGYIAFQIDTSRQDSVSDIQKRDENSQLVSQEAAEDGSVKEAVDSSADSTNENSVNFAKTRGDLNHKGVVPVDLKDK